MNINFNKALLELNAAVIKKYPDAAFYEAQGYLVPTDSLDMPVDGTVIKDKFKAVYTKYGEGKTIIATFCNDGKINIELINDPWLEDIPMTPYISMTADEAIEFIVNKCGKKAVGPGPITLRHQLFPGEAEPRYFIGTIMALHTVNVYTGKIDVPAGGDSEPTKKSKRIKHLDI